MIRSRSSIPAREVGIAAALTALVAVLCGWGVAHLSPRTLTALPHWVLIGVLGALAAAVLVRAVRSEQLLAPLGILSLTFLAYYFARPLQLSLSSNALLHSSYNYYATPLQTLLSLSGQEITLFVDTRMAGTLNDALTRSVAVLLAFFTAFLIGYKLGVGRRLAARAVRIGAHAGALDVRWVIAAWLGIGLLGEVAIYHKIGGLSNAVTQLGTQGNLAVSFTYLVILNFYMAALIMWTCWHTPQTKTGWIVLGVAVAELAGFYSLLGSRTLVLIPILLMLVAINELRSPVRPRTLVGLVVLGVIFSSGYLAVREAAGTKPFGQILSSVPHYALDAQVILNSSPVFDQLFAETDYIPAHAGYRYGGELGQGLISQTPRFLYPHKPQSTDTTFRQLIWGNEFLAGRPVGAAGEFYRDFGFPGVVVGALVLGILARGLIGLRTRYGGPDGRPLRAALYVIGVVLLYQFLVGSYSILFGTILEIGIPLALAVKLFARPA